MTTSPTLHTSLALLFSELVSGPARDSAYMLNSGDAGLLHSLDRLSATAASKPPFLRAATIAAHTDHVCYGIELMNRWHDGEANPWATADWTASWRRTKVTAAEWKALRGRLKTQTTRWTRALKRPRPLSLIAMSGMISSVAHLAYHLGAIRQIDRATRGPKAS